MATHKPHTAPLDWMVIGAGPAGIAAVGKLLDAGIPSKNIGWMDSHFESGDLGLKWGQVPSNTKVSLFLRYLNACQSFNYKNHPQKFPIDSLNPESNCSLKEIAAPLKWVTNHLKEKVHAVSEIAMALNLYNSQWKIKTKDGAFYAKNVILATGSDAKKLNYPEPEIISLEVALNIEKLKAAVKPDDVIAVFGASHSAILILANLVQLNLKKIINFYRSPHLYAIYFDDWILFDDTGLKGFTAKWAKENLDGKHPHNLHRLLTSDHTFEEVLGTCNKAIYAVGFERRKLPLLEQFEKMEYNDKTGIIAPGLFGVGIAFPQAKFDRLGNLEYRVGLWKFMEYLDIVLPLWIKYTN